MKTHLQFTLRQIALTGTRSIFEEGEGSSVRRKKKLDLYVVRVGQESPTVLSRPCQHCTVVMKSFGIRRVFYSTGDPTKPWKCESIQRMLQDKANPPYKTRTQVETGCRTHKKHS